MKANMGTSDKAIRLIAATLIAALYSLHVISGTWAFLLLVLAAVFILTSLVSFCPLYLPFGITTRKKGTKR